MTIDVPLPPLKEQQRIVGRIDSLVSKIEEARLTCEKAGMQSRLLAVSLAHRADLSDQQKKSIGVTQPDPDETSAFAIMRKKIRHCFRLAIIANLLDWRRREVVTVHRDELGKNQLLAYGFRPQKWNK